jgi:hypothetical protein
MSIIRQRSKETENEEKYNIRVEIDNTKYTLITQGQWKCKEGLEIIPPPPRPKLRTAQLSQNSATNNNRKFPNFRAGLDDMEKRNLLTPWGLELRTLGYPARSQSLYRLRYPCS